MATIHTVQSIHIYPIKSLAGISLNEGFASITGFQYDREWMLIDENNKMITQRDLPKLCLFQQKISSEYLTISFNDSIIAIPLQSKEQALFTCKVWNDEVDVFEVDANISSWFSEQLNIKCKIVRVSNNHKRIHHKKGEISMSLADGYPYLFIGTASLDLLNSKLEDAVEMNRFRPNLVIHSETAHDEDGWKTFDLGTAKFNGSHPCGRCQVVTINQTTAIANKEPLRTLSSYRKTGQRVNFGMNVFCTDEGVLKIGDSIAFH